MNANRTTHLLIIGLLLTQVALSATLTTRLVGLSRSVERALATLPQSLPLPDPTEDVSVDDDPFLGTAGAPVVIVEFGDYECPFCADAAGIVDLILSEYEVQVLFVYRDFPLEKIHPQAFNAALAANCAGSQESYWQMHDLLFENQSDLGEETFKRLARELGLNLDLFAECMHDRSQVEEVQHDIEDGSKYLVNGTPTFFVNRHRIYGGSLEEFREAIETSLAEKGG